MADIARVGSLTGSWYKPRSKKDNKRNKDQGQSQQTRQSDSETDQGALQSQSPPESAKRQHIDEFV